MQAETLIRMANQIAAFYTPYDDEEAINGIETHLRNFWEPRMRRELAALAAADPGTLSDRVRAAIGRMAETN